MPNSEIPRRNDQHRMTMAELAITEAIAVTETVGADPRLTDAVVLLGCARDSVADYVDGVPTRRSVTIEEQLGPAHQIARLNNLSEAIEAAARSLSVAVIVLEPMQATVGDQGANAMAVEVQAMRGKLSDINANVQAQVARIFNNG